MDRAEIGPPGRIGITMPIRWAHLVPRDTVALDSGLYEVVRVDLIQATVHEGDEHGARLHVVLDPYDG